ncbi:polysaccharide biosynthesis tyrosine autokinase [Arthrobacter sp. UKPF54-2]|uniref:polysaccharide biosynthesis tyrosine autokinase n=1 Tax=Arthrobacter sp. UKPF54-2 TaxID=2600159 RepID=UPI0011B11EDC|nr:polysaccharide biosynthesis tyrosine autokinase [Arthrobacter sp. UKPF54-2]QDY90242.1 polysaccharide biosynthesis tyrosine autokinase [Arthrobacter sp. UKPF54-2]
MDIPNYLRLLRRHWILVVAGALIGILAGGAVSALARPTYTAETQLFVAIPGSGSTTDLQEGNTFSQSRVQSYLKTVASPMVLQPAIDTLGLSESAESLAKRVTATADINTVLVDIRVVDSSPAQAVAVAQAVSNGLIRAVDNLEKPKTGGQSPVSLSITKPATAPTAPSSPNVGLNLLLWLGVGLGVGLLLAFLRSALDSKIADELDLRRVTDAPLLAGIPFDRDAAKAPLLNHWAAGSRAESYRRLRTNLQFMNIPGRSKIILVTSSVPGEGASTTAINLAVAVAKAGQSVCLVDANLHRPRAGEYLGLERREGLTDVLTDSGVLGDLIQQSGEMRLFVLASGPVPPNPSELLGSAEMKAVLDYLASRFDSIIIDAPALIPFTDAAVLSQDVGGVVLVVGASEARIRELKGSLDALRMAGANLLGVVINRVAGKRPTAYSPGDGGRYARTEDADAPGRHAKTTLATARDEDGPDQVAADSAEMTPERLRPPLRTRR